MFVFPLFFLFTLHSPHAPIHPYSVANACNPPRQTGTAVTPLAGFSHVDVRQAIGLQGNLVRVLIDIVFH